MMDLAAVLAYRPAAIKIVPHLFCTTDNGSMDSFCVACKGEADHIEEVKHKPDCPIAAFLKVIDWPGKVEGKPDL